MDINSLSPGKRAVVHRARLLTEFEWTPLRDVPTYTKKTGKTTFPAGKPVKGMIYSSTEPTDKFICENISLETLSTIINNPDSALYCKDNGGHRNSWPYFGVVCNGLVRYALNIRRRYSTKRWLTVPGIHKIFEASTYTVDQLEVCDVLYTHGEARSHVALITDLIHDGNGKVNQVEVSEAIRPSCVRRVFTAEEFYEKFKIYAICRYDYIDSVPEPDENEILFATKKQSSQLPDIALDYGNKTNYRTNEDVVISVFREEKNEVEIACNGKLLETIHIDGRGKVSRRFEKGYYTARLASTGETLEFCVTEPEISHSVKDGKITIRANSNDSESSILYMEFREKTRSKFAEENNQTLNVYCNPCCSALAKLEELTEEEKSTGVFSREIAEDAYNFKVYFENKYGRWTHTMIEI